MNSERTLGYAAFAIAAFLVVSVLAIGLGWPFWVWLVVVLVLWGADFFAYSVERRNVQQRRHFEPPQAPPPPPEPVRYEQVGISEASLRTALEDYAVLFSGVVWWRKHAGSVGNHADPAALAVHTVLNRAREHAVRESPENAPVLRDRLGSTLGVSFLDPSHQIEIMVAEVKVALPEHDRARLNELAELRKDRQRWEHKREHERNKREYLADDVLKDPGSAVVWWLSRNETEIDQAVRNIEPLTTLSRAANNSSEPEAPVSWCPATPPRPFGDDGAFLPPVVAPTGVVGMVRDLLDSAGLDADSDAGVLTIERIAGAFSAAGATDAAEAIRREFDLSSTADDDHAEEADQVADGDHEAQRDGKGVFGSDPSVPPRDTH